MAAAGRPGVGDLAVLPVPEHLFGVGDLVVSEDVRMASDHLRRRRLRHLGDVEPPLLVGDLGMHRHLQQEVAELVSEPLVVTGLDGFEDLVGLFEQVWPQRFVRLLAVPGTAVRLAQPVHDVEDRRQARTVWRHVSLSCQRSRFFHGPRARPSRPGRPAAPAASPRPGVGAGACSAAPPACP